MKPLYLVTCSWLFLVRATGAEAELKLTPTDIAQYLAGTTKIVTVVGEADLKVPADRALVTLNVTTENRSFKEALAANQQIIGKLAAYLQQQGIPAAQVQTAKFASTPRHGSFSDKIRSFRLQNEVRISARTDQELQAVAGALEKWSEVTYGGIVFEHSDKETLRQKAIAQACDNATARRKIYEDKLGLKMTVRNVGDLSDGVRIVTRAGINSGMRVGVMGGTAPSFTGAQPATVSEAAAFDSGDALSPFGELIFKARVAVEYTAEPR